MTEPLVIWTVYDRPRDYPHGTIARMWRIDRDGARPTATCLVAPLEKIRDHLRGSGLICVARAEEDDPPIVESWL